MQVNSMLADFSFGQYVKNVRKNKLRKNAKNLLTYGPCDAIITPVSQTNGFEPIRTALANGVTVAPTTLTRIV